mmetsp:Transcript_28242/g.13079  ORF Transcript_28242/g.13079 Transcript_28242/m.13079 type:complete len:85 (+) Transcript_28242:103-357(+)
MQMEMFLKGGGGKAGGMARACCIRKMGLCTEELELMIRNLEMAWKFGGIIRSMRGSLWKGRKMGKGGWCGIMGIIMKAYSKIKK